MAELFINDENEVLNTCVATTLEHPTLLCGGNLGKIYILSFIKDDWKFEKSQLIHGQRI